MTLKNSLRVRFAPAPTGMMHLGNIRTVLMNYLMARQKQGTFVLRIEDTDAERNYDPNAKKIMEDLSWLNLIHDEGPGKKNTCGPYFQSQRNDIYQAELKKLIEINGAYRCFCSPEELEKKRERQIALKLPPRYDRTCLSIDKKVATERAKTASFIWRMKMNPDATLSLFDLSHGTVTFELKNFSDFALTRDDGTVTFLFANFVDDALMKITHVIRGEDHLSNTACQLALYKAMNYEQPLFWHLPILCNSEGKKLSKRDFGFSLRDLKDAGFLPEAIVNYLGIIGGSFKNEIMTLEELVTAVDFDHIHTTGQIRYDVEKLRWTNHKWINLLPIEKIATLCRPYLESVYLKAKSADNTELIKALQLIRTEMFTLRDCIQLLAFYFDKPVYELDIMRTLMPIEQHAFIKNELQKLLPINDKNNFANDLKDCLKKHSITPKSGYGFVRYALMGKLSGPAIPDIIEALGTETATARLTQCIINLI